MNKCAIFDLDGTILDTINTISFHANNTLRHFSLPEIDSEKYKYLAGNGARVLVARMLKQVGGYDEESFEEIYNYYLKEYESNTRIFTEKFDGIEELLKTLKNHGYKLAVLSNKPNAAVQDIVEYFYDSLFDVVYGSFEDLPKKPDTTVLNRIIEELDADKSRSIYIGDTDCDMKTGKAGGLYTIGVLWGFRTEKELIDNNADLIVSKPSEIIDHLHHFGSGID